MADDPYVYPGTNVLRNLADIHDVNRLREFESIATFKRILELEYQDYRGDFDTEHLQKVHHYILQDVYSWAGQFRTVDMGKDDRWFCRPEFIKNSAERLLGDLRKEQCLAGRDLRTFVLRAAYYLSELNAIHPFREGNGRTQREFIREIGAQARFKIDWTRVSRQQMYSASEVSFNTGNSEPLADILKNVTSPL